MTILDMQYQFGQQLNQFDEALQLHSDDIEYWLNKGQLELVKELYNGTNRQRLGFEQSQERIDDLRPLTERNFALDPSYSADEVGGTAGSFTDIVTFPNNYMFLISHKSKIIYNYPEISFTIDSGKRVTTGGISKIVSNKLMQSDTVYRMMDDPFNKPKASTPFSVITNNKLHVFTDKTFIVDKVYIDYIKYPTDMSIEYHISSVLPEHLHKDIIQKAVDLFLNNTRELKQRLQRETPTADKQQNIDDNE